MTLYKNLNREILGKVQVTVDDTSLLHDLS